MRTSRRKSLARTRCTQISSSSPVHAASTVLGGSSVGVVDSAPCDTARLSVGEPTENVVALVPKPPPQLASPAAAALPKPVPDDAIAANDVDAPLPHEQAPPLPLPQLQPPVLATEAKPPPLEAPQLHAGALLAGAGFFASGASPASGAARFTWALM